MALTHNQIIQDIENKKYAPVYFLYGDESYFIDQVMDKIEHSILPESEKSFNQVSLYGREVDFKQVADHARQFPMMAERKVVLLKEAHFMRDFDMLQSYFENPSPHTILAIAYKKSTDKRKKVFKTLLKESVTLESKKLYDNQVAPWIEKYIQSKERKIHPRSAMIMASMLGSDLNKIANEINKLCLLVEEGAVIEESLVFEQIGLSKEFNIFEMQSAISARDLNKAMGIAEHFAENHKDHPLPRELASLTNHFQKLSLAKAHVNLGDVEFARKVGLYSPRFAREYKLGAKLYSFEEITGSFRHLLEADKKSKGVGAHKASPESIWFDLIFNIVNRQ